MRKKALLTAILLFLAFVIIPLTVSAQDIDDMPYDPTAADAMGIVLNIISLVISIVIAIYMYKDAEARGSRAFQPIERYARIGGSGYGRTRGRDSNPVERTVGQVIRGSPRGRSAEPFRP